MYDTCTVYGNYGELIVRRDTGEVTAYLPGIDATLTNGYYDIVRVNPQDMHPTGNCDIVCCGFWTRDGKYWPRCQEPLS